MDTIDTLSELPCILECKVEAYTEKISGVIFMTTGWNHFFKKAPWVLPHCIIRILEECTLFKRNATFLNPFFPVTLGHWTWPRSCTFCQMVLRVTCKIPHCNIHHGSLAILACLSTCHFRLMTKQLKSHCNQCKLGSFFSKWCISFGQECMSIESLGIVLILQC